MDLSLTALHARAMALERTVAAVPLRAERLRGAKRAKARTLQSTAEMLRDLPSLFESKVFSDKELAEMLANACLETGSFLYAAGAPPDVWREWCGLAGAAFFVAKDPSYAMHLRSIARAPTDDDLWAALRDTKFPRFRCQAIQCVIFRPQLRRTPYAAPVDLLDEYYEALLHALDADDVRGMRGSITDIVEYWLGETSQIRFEPGRFPDFDPEINAIVAALVRQGYNLEIRNPPVKSYLRAALESPGG